VLYTPEGGTVQVESYREDERIIVSVRDTGRGIAEDMLDRVFDLFAQAERTQGGLGVGLTLSKRLVEAHAGRITARSEGLLGIMGHTTKAANSGELALALAEEFRPEVVILDIGMPQMDGYETARRLRALPWADATLLIALTGWEDASDQAKAKQSGFDAHVVKPGDLQVLARLISRERVR
jgi:CheY-like chemotaxis protein